jgi:hypothetical protein
MNNDNFYMPKWIPRKVWEPPHEDGYVLVCTDKEEVIAVYWFGSGDFWTNCGYYTEDPIGVDLAISRFISTTPLKSWVALAMPLLPLPYCPDMQ